MGWYKAGYEAKDDDEQQPGGSVHLFISFISPGHFIDAADTEGSRLYPETRFSPTCDADCHGPTLAEAEEDAWIKASPAPHVSLH